MHALVATSILLITVSTVAVSNQGVGGYGYPADSTSNDVVDGSDDPYQNLGNSPQASSGEVIGPEQGSGNVPLIAAGPPGISPETVSVNPGQDSNEGSIESNEGQMRTIDLSEMISNATRLEERLRGHPTVTVITDLISILRRISPSDVAMLANPQRTSDNELVDSVLVANNLVNIMLAASDEELFRRPPNVGALILASNDIDNYIRTHLRNSRLRDRRF